MHLNKKITVIASLLLAVTVLASMTLQQQQQQPQGSSISRHFYVTLKNKKITKKCTINKTWYT